jgi:hypothetical protein
VGDGDIVNPWATGNAAVERFLERCHAMDRLGSGGELPAASPYPCPTNDAPDGVGIAPWAGDGAR